MARLTAYVLILLAIVTLWEPTDTTWDAIVAAVELFPAAMFGMFGLGGVGLALLGCVALGVVWGIVKGIVETLIPG